MPWKGHKPTQKSQIHFGWAKQKPLKGRAAGTAKYLSRNAAEIMEDGIELRDAYVQAERETLDWARHQIRSHQRVRGRTV
jgi:hypothetical protein